MHKMNSSENDDTPMLLDGQFTQHDRHRKIEPRPPQFTTRTRSASLAMLPYSMSFGRESDLVSYTGPLTNEKRTLPIHASGPLHSKRKPDDSILNMNVPNSSSILALEYLSGDSPGKRESSINDGSGANEHLWRSGQLGMCNDPYCTVCPTYNNHKAKQQKNSKYESDKRLQTVPDHKGWGAKSFLYSYIHGVVNPHNRAIQRWNKFFVLACLAAIFVDPLFFLLLSADEENKCIMLDRRMAITIAAVRSFTDFIYLVHMIIQFRLAYVAPESTVVGAGDLVDHPKKIALNYLRGYFLLDLFVVLPLPQIMILFVIPKYIGRSAANYAKNLLRAAILLQYVPRIFRCFPLLAGNSPSGFIFETAWSNFIINLLMFVLAGHVVGSCWYLFGLQRVNQCLRKACYSQTYYCKEFLDCGNNGKNIDRFKKNETWSSWTSWKSNLDAINCFDKDANFKYGIYKEAVRITTSRSNIDRYIYSLFWGFQQISTLAGNQVPSSFVWEVLFTMGIIGLGLFLFALLIGNMQNFLQALGKRKLEMQLRRHDVEQWMSHRRLPESVKSRVRRSERFTWAATQGVNEEALLGGLSEDLQIDIRRHLFKFIKKVRIFALMDDPVFDAICERLRHRIYTEGSKILYYGAPVDKMVFIVRGRMESVDADGNRAELSDRNVCGEELLAFCLDNLSIYRDGTRGRYPGYRLLSNRTVTCLTNVEAFSLKGADIEEVTSYYEGFLRKPLVQAAIRYESPYWRGRAASIIQVAWRYRKKRLNRTDSNSFRQ